MNCPKCGKPMRKGFVEARAFGDIFNMDTQTQLIWYPEECDKQRIKKEKWELKQKNEGCFCEDCGIVSSVLELY